MPDMALDMGETRMYGSVTPGEADVMLSESSTPLPVSSASSSPARKVVGLLCIAAAAVGALSFASPSMTATAESALAPGEPAKATTPEPMELMIDPTEVDMDLEKDSYETVIVQSDFLSYPRVKEWLKDVHGLDQYSDPAILSNFVPEKMVVRGRPQLIMGGGKEGTMGEDVMDGLTLFAISYWNQTEATVDSPFVYSSAFNIVVNMRGDVVSITPTYYDLQSKYHFVALKPYPLDTDYMMGTVDIEKTQKGPVYLWNWRKNQPKEFVQLTPEGEVYDCHDLNWNVGGDGFWVTTGDDGFSQYEQKTGTQIAEVKFDHYLVNDPNHLQMIEKDTFAILSSRGSNSILNINVNTQQAKWIMGGQNSSMDMYDEDGRLVPAHSPEDQNIFFGQHNAEYMGDDKYYLFNDGDNIAGSKDNVDVKAQNASSLMIIKVVYNESARGTTQEFTGHVVWRYDLGVYTQFYGDHDRLMNGNSLGTFWNSVRNAPGVQAQSYLLEVTEGKEVAWSLKVYGNNTAKKDINSHGWLVYSAERFYEKPTISRVSCKEFTTPAGPSITVYFTAHNNFRQNNVYQGTYRLSNPSHLPAVNETEVDLKGTFDFVPYWRDTKIEVTWENVGTCDGTTITVENQWGQRTNTTFAYDNNDDNTTSTNTSSAF